MQRITCQSPAKINLFLRVYGLREDGYHNLQSVFQILDWYDILFFTTATNLQFTVSTHKSILQNEENLIVKAAQLLASYSNIPCHAAIHLDKKIALGGGFGGGSSNAAVTLMALNQLWQLNLSPRILFQLGERLGSDVPFFIAQKNALVEDRGERLKKINIDPCWYVIFLTNTVCKTKKVFNAYRQSSQRLTTAKDRVRLPALDTAKPLRAKELVEFGNDLILATFDQYPQLEKIYQSIEQSCRVFLTGTGSSFFTIASSESEANALAKLVGQSNQVYCKIIKGINSYNYCIDGV